MEVELNECARTNAALRDYLANLEYDLEQTEAALNNLQHRHDELTFRLLD